MPASIIGANGCGRTVFWGLLYESLVQLTNASNIGHGEMRFSTEPQTAMVLGDIRLDLMSGRWPSGKHNDMISECAIELGFRRRSFLGLFPSTDFDIMKVQNFGTEENDMRAIMGTRPYIEASSGKDIGGSLDLGAFSESFRDHLDSSVLVLLIDVSQIIKVDDIEMSSAVKGTDALYATILKAAIMKRRKGVRGGSDAIRISPILFLTKCDQMNDPRIGLEGSLNTSGKSSEDEVSGLDDREAKTSRRKRALDIIREHYPNTMNVLETGQEEQVRFQKVELFLSGLGTEKDGSGTMTPSTRVDKGQVCLDYPYDEYVAFIDLLGGIAKKHPDVIKTNENRK
jgi:hypothetical protein